MEISKARINRKNIQQSTKSMRRAGWEDEWEGRAETRVVSGEISMLDLIFSTMEEVGFYLPILQLS